MRKYRIKIYSNCDKTIYYPQYKDFLFWHYFNEDSIYGGSCRKYFQAKTYTLNYIKEDKKYIKHKKEIKESKKVKIEYI